MTLDAELFGDIRQNLAQQEILKELKSYFGEKGLLTDSGQLPDGLEERINAASERSKSKHLEYTQIGFGKGRAKAIHSAEL